MLVRVSFSSGSELDTEHVDLDRRSNRIHSVAPSNGAYCTPGPAPHRALDFRYVQCDLVRKANFERQSDSLWGPRSELLGQMEGLEDRTDKETEREIEILIKLPLDSWEHEDN